MTTETQNQWASMLEDASQRETRQMAEYAIDHIEDMSEARALQAYLREHMAQIQPLENAA